MGGSVSGNMYFNCPDIETGSIEDYKAVCKRDSDCKNPKSNCCPALTVQNTTTQLGKEVYKICGELINSPKQITTSQGGTFSANYWFTCPEGTEARKLTSAVHISSSIITLFASVFYLFGSDIPFSFSAQS